MYAIQYGLITLSIGSFFADFWEGFKNVIGTIFSFIDQAILGIGKMFVYLQVALPITGQVLQHMPIVIGAAAMLTLLIFVLRFLIGGFIG